MARWDINTADNSTTRSFDDHLQEHPGEEGFTTEAVRGELQPGETFNWVGPSDANPA